MLTSTASPGQQPGSAAIRPSGGGGPLAAIKRTWRYRWLLWQWTRRDFTVQYRQSLLGLAWSVVQPLVLLLLYGTVFSGVLKVRAPGGNYAVFALCGLVPWSFISTAVMRSTQSLVNAQIVIKQVYFPRSIVPLASAGITTIDLAVATLILLIFEVVTEGRIHLATLALVPVYIGLILLMGGISIFVGLIGALVRDIRFVVPLIIQVGFIATPIMYPQTLVPHRYAWVYRLNPVTAIIQAVRGAVLDGHWPSLGLLAGVLLTGAAVLVLAIWYSASVEDRLPDLL